MFFLVPLYSTCSSIQNLQSIRSIQLFVMVTFSCAAYAGNHVVIYFISDRGDIVSAFGAFVIGICGNVYSRLGGGTAFTSMVTGVLFLVPVSLEIGGVSSGICVSRVTIGSCVLQSSLSMNHQVERVAGGPCALAHSVLAWSNK